jgi:hypothetical protein
MEAARLKPVEDRIDRGVNGLPTAGTYVTGKSGSVIGLPAPLSAATPKPEAAINSGTKLADSFLSPSNKISNGQGRLYDGQPDNDEDDVPLSVQGTGTQKLETAFEAHRGASRNSGTEAENVETEVESQEE